MSVSEYKKYNDKCRLELLKKYEDKDYLMKEILPCFPMPIEDIEILNIPYHVKDEESIIPIDFKVNLGNGKFLYIQEYNDFSNVGLKKTEEYHEQFLEYIKSISNLDKGK